MQVILRDRMDKWASQFEKRTYKRGDMILQYSEGQGSLYYLVSGYVRLFTTTTEGKDLTFAVHKPGTCFPLQFLLSDVPAGSPYIYEAVSPVVLYRLPLDQCLHLLRTDPEACFYFLERFSHALTGFVTRMEQSLLPKPLEIEAVLRYLAVSFGEKTTDGTVRIPFPLTAETLSTWTGVARETVTRVLSALRKKKHFYSKNLYFFVEPSFLDAA